MGKSSLTGTVNGKVQWEGHIVEYTARVSGTEWYTPGRMYMPNGDPGYPDEYDNEGPFFEEVEWTSILDEKEEEEELQNTDEVYNANQIVIDLAIQRDVEDNKEWDDCSWDEPEPYEPEYEED